MVIPNSVLNTAALTKLTPVSEGMATLEFTAKAPATRLRSVRIFSTA